jgi:hypothetical protein
LGIALVLFDLEFGAHHTTTTANQSALDTSGRSTLLETSREPESPHRIDPGSRCCRHGLNVILEANIDVVFIARVNACFNVICSILTGCSPLSCARGGTLTTWTGLWSGTGGFDRFSEHRVVDQR